MARGSVALRPCMAPVRRSVRSNTSGHVASSSFSASPLACAAVGLASSWLRSCRCRPGVRSACSILKIDLAASRSGAMQRNAAPLFNPKVTAHSGDRPQLLCQPFACKAVGLGSSWLRSCMCTAKLSGVQTCAKLCSSLSLPRCACSGCCETLSCLSYGRIICMLYFIHLSFTYVRTLSASPAHAEAGLLTLQDDGEQLLEKGA